VSPNTPPAKLGLSELDEIVGWHRQFGLQLRFEHSDGAAVTLNGLHGQMVTELLRLARLGLAAQDAMAKSQANERTLFLHAVVLEADTDWKRRFR
jgi:hypothetical protein